MTTQFDWIDPDHTRSLEVMSAMMEEMADGAWHRREDLVAVALAATPEEPLQRDTILALLARAARWGVVDRQLKNKSKPTLGATKYRLARTTTSV